jgi:pimeloyl-ACP methyl ester carboxylesterase
MSGIEQFELAIPQAQLADLDARLKAVRWPERETVDDWSQGAPLAQIKALVEYWRHGYDWRRCEAMLNGFGQYRTEIEGLGIHFLHIRSPEKGALPLLMTHGWPGSVLEFHKVVGPLTDPVAHGGSAEDAFDLVLPSLPGYGFSDKPAQTGWGVNKIADVWMKLMSRLGYSRYVAQGGDWGSAVTTAIGIAAPSECAAIHLNLPVSFPNAADMAEMGPAEAKAVERLREFNGSGNGYAIQQSTKPQTLAYGLVDSPVAQAAWIYEKFHGWSDCEGDPRTVFTFDELLDNIMIYWLQGNGASSARLYWESMECFGDTTPVAMPTGVSMFPKEIFQPSRRMVERRYTNLVYWNEPNRGGHFAAFEQPRLFVTELRNCFRPYR